MTASVATSTSTVVAYVRVSTAEQAQSGAGLEAQRAAIRAEADRRGWTITAWHTDEGLSGSLPIDHRPGLTAAVAAVRAGDADTLIVAKSDRLARNIRTLVNLTGDALAERWGVTAVDGSIDTTTTSGIIMTNILAAIADGERRMIGDRTREALAAKRAQGVRLGRPSDLPVGTVTSIITAHDAGESMNAIARQLTADGVATARGGVRWYASTVRAVLNSQDAATIRSEVLA